MGAFDILFQNRRQPSPLSRFQQGGVSKLGIVGLAGLGYAAYRYLKTERGQEVQRNVVDQVRNFGERMRAQTSRGTEAQN